jgi:hypothetical protein
MSWKCYEHISYFTENEDTFLLHHKATVTTNLRFGVLADFRISIVVFSFTTPHNLVDG